MTAFVAKQRSYERILLLLSREGPLTPTQIISKTSYSERTVRYALSKLKAQGKVRNIPSFDDMRKILYHVQEG